MEIVDAYCGVGPWQRRDPLLPWKTDDIVALLDHAGVGRALVHSNFVDGGGFAPRGNAQVVEACRAHSRLIPAWTVVPFQHPDEPTLDEQFEAMRGAGARALWFLPARGNARTWIYGDMLGTCARRKVPVFTSCEHLGPEDIATLMAAVPALRLVLCSAGYRDDWWLFPLLKRHATLSVCTGHYYIPTFNPMRFLQTFRADRLLFGSGLPHFSPGGMVAHLAYADIPDADREKILSGNLIRLLEEAWS
jgi:predicted TIM-barrel fold metal-dependent hydrolase